MKQFEITERVENKKYEMKFMFDYCHKKDTQYEESVKELN